jgi:hypothetical protein
MFRNKKKWGVTAGLLLCAGLLLGGCGNAIPDMNKAQEEAIEQYAAAVLMQYDKRYKSRLVPLPEETLETVEIEETVETTKQVSVPSESVPSQEESRETQETHTPDVNESYTAQTMTMEAFLGLPQGVTVVFNGTRTTDFYPDNQEGEVYFGVDAPIGEQLLLLELTISNQTDREQSIDILSLDPEFRVTVNDTARARVMTTLLEDDMSTYMGTIPAGGGVATVLLAEIPLDIIPERLTLRGSTGEITAVIFNNIDLK